MVADPFSGTQQRWCWRPYRTTAPTLRHADPAFNSVDGAQPQAAGTANIAGHDPSVLAVEGHGTFLQPSLQGGGC